MTKIDLTLRALLVVGLGGACDPETATTELFVKTKTANLEDNWVKAAEAKGLKEPKKVLADYRAEIARLQK